ncbi:DUF937 domain-containing protein [Aquabacter spiritensis]|uniref:DUF937 domain-containing protein n=1 Tax=Aquabacter spiritensis TaxID=933073 RepID=A0A4R3LU22_9HYPH|nr:DUF937 domain-containing protein [Aquabacter spiritensis]TCT03466.1 hypothetical protein EDC64_10916 [Aquabacter spiritensis]
MDPFVQLLRAAQGGEGMNNLARFYGLSLQQAQLAAETLMPAFAAGLQRSMQSPEGLASLMVLMMRGPYGALYDRGPSADLTQSGTTALDAMFGSPEITRAVMNQAASTTGLGVNAVRQVTPAFAALLLGGLTKSLAASGALNQMLAGMIARASGQPTPTGNPWVDGMATMMSSPNRGGATGNPWIDAFADMMVRSPWGGQTAQMPGNPWPEMIAATLAAMGAAVPKREPLPLPPPPPPPPPPAPPALGQWPFQDYFAQLFATGFPPPGGPPGRDRAPSPFDPFAAFMPMADFWSQMLDRTSGHQRGRTGPADRKK